MQKPLLRSAAPRVLSAALRAAWMVSTASYAAPEGAVAANGTLQLAAGIAMAAALAAAIFAWLWLTTRRKPAPAPTPVPGGGEIVESARDAIFVIEDDGAIVNCNAAAESLFGVPLADIRGKSISALIPPPERGRRRGNYIHSAEGRVLHGIRRSGNRFPLDLMLSELPSSGGKRFSIIVRDRSERTRAEQELEANQKLASDIVDHEGRIVRFNRACEDLTQFSEGELRGQYLWQALAAPAGMQAAESAFYRLLEGELPARSASDWCLRDNSRRTLHWLHNAIRDEYGRISYVVSVGADLTRGADWSGVTDRPDALEAAQRMAGGIAHNFNNLLTTISGYSSLVLASLDPSHAARRDVEEIRKAGDTAAVLTRQLLAFSGRHPRQPQLVDLNEIVRGAERLLRQVRGDAPITLSQSLEPGLPPVTADPRQLEECILHLCANACQAMPEGGGLHIETSTRSLSRRRADARPPLEPGDYVTVSVTDTGQGIPQSALPHIFEPFYSTRDVAKSHGMGLSIAYGIAHQNGGSFLVHSAPGQGATFCIFFPVQAAAHPEVEALAEPEAELSGGDETVLVATENDGDRRLMRDSLQQAGYFVLEARSALQAMEIAHKAPDAIHLAICDIYVPRMSGPELAATLRGIRGEIRSLLATSRGEDEIRRQGLEPAAVVPLGGPSGAKDFLHRVRQALTAPRTRGAAR